MSRIQITNLHALIFMKSSSVSQILLPPAHVVRGKVIVSVCLSVHTSRGVPTSWAGGYLPS